MAKEEIHSANEKIRLSEDVARDQMNKFLDFYDIYPDDMEEGATKINLLSSIKKIIRSIQNGTIEIVLDEKGHVNVLHHLKFSLGELNTITYGVITGRNKTQMSSKKEQDVYGKIDSLMGTLSKEGEAVMAGLIGPDMGIKEALGSIFLHI